MEEVGTLEKKAKGKHRFKDIWKDRSICGWSDIDVFRGFIRCGFHHTSSRSLLTCCTLQMQPHTLCSHIEEKQKPASLAAYMAQ